MTKIKPEEVIKCKNLIDIHVLYNLEIKTPVPQILGGYLSDRFGAERVLLGSVLGWGLLTFWFHQIVYLSQDHDSAINLIVFSRVMMGAFQGKDRIFAERMCQFFLSGDTGWGWWSETFHFAFGCSIILQADFAKFQSAQAELGRL